MKIVGEEAEEGETVKMPPCCGENCFGSKAATSEALAELGIFAAGAAGILIETADFVKDFSADRTQGGPEFVSKEAGIARIHRGNV